ncbi:PRKC apoptosis WT1 regulator protein [Hyperolius riggenbachi]|uniref:PRKC apoptosis WT1 regulator protein n=1 Tax=Hyperolius riggenbachi TaxID=752182 RepID=UPI0035A33F76
MASGGYRAHNPSSSNTTDFLEEWKAKREKMRAKMYAAEMGATGTPGATDSTSKTSNEMNNNTNNAPSSNSQATSSVVVKVPANSRTVEDQQVSSVVSQQKKAPGPVQDVITGGHIQEETPPAASQESASKAKEKGKSFGPSARKGKGQIEKRKLREKRRSTGVVSLPSAESPDEYDDDEAGQKERKREDTVTQDNTAQNESLCIDPSEWQGESVSNVPNRYKSVSNAPDEEPSNRYSHNDRISYGRYGKDANSVNSGQGGSLEKKIEELEKELARERQESLKLVKLLQDKEELMMKMKEEIDLLNRDLDDIEDENKQLKQENKTLLKVVGQLTR